MHGLLQGRRLQPAPRGVPNRPQPECLDQRDDVRKPAAPFEKRADGDFVRRVEHCRCSTAGLRGTARQGQCGETLEVGRFEIETSGAQNVERFYTRAQPLRPAQRVRNRSTHVGVAQLRQHRAVDVLDQRMHDALRVNDDVDLARRQAEQQAGLDQLQALVHQRCGVDRDLAAHYPARMRASLVGRDIT
jgi:hypothetical protein